MDPVIDRDEERRLAALYAHGFPAGIDRDALRRIVRIVQLATDASMVSISAIGRNQEVVLAASGIPTDPIDRTLSLAAQVIAGRDPMIIEDISAEPAHADCALVSGDPGIKAYMGAPIMSEDGRPIGVLSVMSDTPRRFALREIDLVANLAGLAATQMAAGVAQDRDMLTGVPTRRRFLGEVEREFERARRYGCPAALVFIEIDGAAEINRTIGPRAGEEIIKAVANRASEELRATDVLGRLAGEEFGLLLPETMAYEASQCAERLRETIGAMSFRAGGKVLSVTASLGIANFVPELASGIQWFAQADVALYQAKKSGRNCVAFAPPVETADGPTAATDEIVPSVRFDLH
ncbi:sensor domain-containing diguanylate cyclase [Pelagibacterium montanilacus]|uniref:sensor domain-containing diguanylate cyclase n=1 Tax=Pelagibacterium montanilacus TaxID=2185280 RepID=UPI000F8E50A3|nr:sensor domain-containing diguanylate cyclase [Pelagibacterium montanilacus]